MRKAWLIIGTLSVLVLIGGAVLYAQNRPSDREQPGMATIYPDEWPDYSEPGIPAAITSVGRFLYVVKGNWLYKLSADSLYVHRRVWLGRPDVYRVEPQRGPKPFPWPLPEQFRED